jgi:hypothetical protein
MSSRRARHAARSRIPFAALVGALVVAVAVLGAVRLGVFAGEDGDAAAPSPSASPAGAASPSVTPTANPSPTESATPAETPTPGPINTSFEGMTTFRGNATRSWYGRGPVPRNPKVLWRYPAEGDLCSTSSDQHGERLWCGTGWTGQPNVIVGRGRLDRGADQRVRRRVPLPRRAHRRADPAEPADG